MVTDRVWLLTVTKTLEGVTMRMTRRGRMIITAAAAAGAVLLGGSGAVAASAAPVAHAAVSAGQSGPDDTWT